jgi:hypothetical protein
MRTLILFAFLAQGAFAQWKLMALNGAAERLVEDVYDLGSIDLGDELEARFRLRNMGSAANTGPITIAGSGFLLEGPTSATVANGGFLDFTVRFSPRSAGTFSAGLLAAHGSTVLRATAAAAPVVRAGGDLLRTGSVMNLGECRVDSSCTRRISLENHTSVPLVVPPLALIGDEFAVRGSLPPELGLGESVFIDLVFIPKGTDERLALLTVGGKRITLRGIGLPPPLPAAALLADALVRSAEQRRVTVRLDAPARSDGQGELTMALEAGSGDPAVLFANGGRKAVFSVRSGQQEFTFDYQTGSTAGVIRFYLTLGATVTDTAVEVAAESVRVTAAQAEREIGSLLVRVTGFDNTRSASSLSFTFFDQAGAEVGKHSVNAGEGFLNYFRDSSAGGTFSLEARFPVTGDASRIHVVEVEIGNLAGASRERILF